MHLANVCWNICEDNSTKTNYIISSSNAILCSSAFLAVTAFEITYSRASLTGRVGAFELVVPLLPTVLASDRATVTDAAHLRREPQDDAFVDKPSPSLPLELTSRAVQVCRQRAKE